MKQDSPIVIGGLGGSGTRLIADILIQAGVFLGDRLNSPLDNLWFTLLFVHRGYLEKEAIERDSIISHSLDIFSRKMKGNTNYSAEDLLLLHQAARNHHNTRGLFGSEQNFVTEFMKKTNRTDNQSGLWGWKEPNTHIYLDYLIDYFLSLRYIHIIRCGLDMAYSKNQNQLRRWGPLFDIQQADSADISPQNAFDFWQLMNRRAIKLASKMPQNRFLLVNYDNLCNSPETGVARILDFLEVPLTQKQKKTLISLPLPVSIDSHRDHDLSWFGEEQKKTLESLGFSL